MRSQLRNLSDDSHVYPGVGQSEQTFLPDDASYSKSWYVPAGQLDTHSFVNRLAMMLTPDCSHDVQAAGLRSHELHGLSHS